MTHFVRFAMIGALVAGASVCAIAQDDDSLEALLEGLGDETVMEEVAESEPAAEEEAAAPAEVEEEIAAEPVAEEPSEAVAELPEEPEAADIIRMTTPP